MTSLSWFRELAAPWDALRTVTSPVLYGLGVPYGDARPVLLIPALGVSSATMKPLASWLRRIGYRPSVAEVPPNISCPNGLAARHHDALHAAASVHGQKVVLIGHLGGSHAAAVLASDHAELVSHVIALDCLDADTPFEGVAAMLPSLRRCGIGWCDRCGIGRSLREIVPAEIGVSELAPRRDSSVRGAVIGLPFNDHVYRKLSRLLPQIPVRPIEHQVQVRP